MASISVTCAPRSTSRIARLLPMKPNPPVIKTFFPANSCVSNNVFPSHGTKTSDQRFGDRVDLIGAQSGVHRQRQNLGTNFLRHTQIASSIAQIGERRL